MTIAPSPRALRILRNACAVATATRPGYARAELEHAPTSARVTIETGHPWETADPARLEIVGLRVLWYVARRGMTTAQALRLVELIDVLRPDHGDAVTVRGSRVTIAGSRIAAHVGRDGGAWMTWADGSRTYSHPTPTLEASNA